MWRRPPSNRQKDSKTELLISRAQTPKVSEAFIFRAAKWVELRAISISEIISVILPSLVHNGTQL
jgi:hypothetical protein